jgi:hypothetical protein
MAPSTYMRLILCMWFQQMNAPQEAETL